MLVRLHHMARPVDSKTNCAQVPWPITKEDYEVKECIGVGATSVVHKAYCKPRQQKCAIKIINLEKKNTNIEDLFKEIQVMASCRHQNIVKYHTSFVVGEELWLVLHLLEGGSVLDIIKHKMSLEDCTKGVLDQTAIATILKEVLIGLKYIHDNGQIHRDVKAGNILIGMDGTVQMADFGVSALLASAEQDPGHRIRYTFVGTPCWMAPEVLEQVGGYDFKADIWSFGITAIEMATGTAPYHKYPPLKVIMLTLQNDPPTIDTNALDPLQYDGYGTSFRKMVTDCLQKEPEERPTTDQLLKYPFFKKAKNRKYLAEHLFRYGSSLGASMILSSPSNTIKEHKTETGEWVWPGTEEAKDAEEQPPREDPPEAPTNIGGGDTPSECDLETRKSESEESSPLHMVLRLRDANRILIDIKFDYHLSKDSADSVVLELKNSGLIDPTDVSAVVANLQKFIESYSTVKSVTFPLESDIHPNETASVETLTGFAELSYTQFQKDG